jgi:hypothetical protein
MCRRLAEICRQEGGLVSLIHFVPKDAQAGHDVESALGRAQASRERMRQPGWKGNGEPGLPSLCDPVGEPRVAEKRR